MTSPPASRKPPLLTRRRLAARLKSLRPDWSAELTRAAMEEIILALAETLARGRPVVLNGFGRLEVRRYLGPRKRIGLIFRPAAKLLLALGLLCLILAAGFPVAAWGQDDEIDPLSLVLDPDLLPSQPDFVPSPAAPSQAVPSPALPRPPVPSPVLPPANDADALVIDPDPDPEKPASEDPYEGPPGKGEADPSAPGMTGSNAGTIPIMLVEAAYLAHRRGDFKTAIDGYTRIIRRRGLTRRERAVSYLLRGEAKRDADQLDEAILDFTRALRQWPGYPAAHYFRGRIHEKRNKLNDAYADLAMAAQLDPLRESYQTTLSLLKLRLKEAGLLTDGPPPKPNEPKLPEESARK